MKAVKALAGGKKQSVPTVMLDKYVGEMSVEETEETLTDVDNRIIKQITVNDVNAATVLFDDLMGQGVTARKEYIKLHSKEATYSV